MTDEEEKQQILIQAAVAQRSFELPRPFLGFGIPPFYAYPRNLTRPPHPEPEIIDENPVSLFIGHPVVSLLTNEISKITLSDDQVVTLLTVVFVTPGSIVGPIKTKERTRRTGRGSGRMNDIYCHSAAFYIDKYFSCHAGSSRRMALDHCASFVLILYADRLHWLPVSTAGHHIFNKNFLSKSQIATYHDLKK